MFSSCIGCVILSSENLEGSNLLVPMGDQFASEVALYEYYMKVIG
jgi:hypothetical protein